MLRNMENTIKLIASNHHDMVSAMLDIVHVSPYYKLEQGSLCTYLITPATR